MQSALERVLDLQLAWTVTNTSHMRKRGWGVRHEVAGWLSSHSDELASAIGISTAEFLAEGGDGTGGKARVAWTRFAWRLRSPKPTGGFMAAYLWAFPPENAVYLSLVQGVHDPEALRHKELVRKPLEQIRAHRRWAQEVIADWVSARPDLVPLRLNDRGDKSPGRGYEIGAVASIRYRGGEIPDDGQLLDDSLSVAEALGQIYRAEPPPSARLYVPPVDLSRSVPAAKPPTAAGIQAGSTVEVRDLESGKGRTWTLVAKRDATAAPEQLSVDSPVGQAIVGHDVGDTISVVVPRGTRRYLIERRS